MFTKKSDKDSGMIDPGRLGMPPLKAGAPMAAPSLPGSRPGGTAGRSGAPSVIGADLTITGNLESKGEVQIEGDLQGDVHAAKIVIGERARITGSLTADEIVIRGAVQGSIRGNSVTFQSSSHVEGDVYHKSLAIEQGAFFEGKSRRTDDPMSVPRTNGSMPPPQM
jgi:cytoskeletal protein CcmA (bactofilin family)